MNYRTRSVLFWLATVLFAAIAILSVAYASGYRYSPEFGFTRVGGLAVSTAPSTETEIRVNGKLMKRTTLFSRSVFLQNLTPGKYTINVSKEGFRTWEKTVDVMPELVTALQAILVEDPPVAEKILTAPYTGIRPWNNETIVLEKGKVQTFYSLATRAIVDSATARASSTPATLSDTLATRIASTTPAGFTYDRGGNRMLSWKGSNLTLTWDENATLPFYAESNESVILNAPARIRSAMFYPRREAAIVAFSNGVYLLELDGRGGHILAPIYKGKEPSFVLPESDGEVLYILDDGILFSVKLF